MSIADKITALANAKTQIAAAITANGGTVNDGDGFSDFAADIATITGGTDTRFDALIDGSLSGDITSNASRVKDYSFRGTQITGINLPNALTVGASAFDECLYLTAANLPEVTAIGTNAFRKCSLSTLVAPKVTTIGASILNNNAGGRNSCDVYFPELLTIPASGFSYTSMFVKKMRFDKISSIGGSAFNPGCGGLTELIILSNQVCTLASTTALSGTPIASGTGYIYVPDSLVDSYKSATNWSTYAAQIKGLSELPT